MLWLLRKQANQECFKHRPGAIWLPQTWLQESGLDRAMRDLARRDVDGADNGIEACPNQILLTNGATGAFDLLARYFIRPEDAVLVDDPGHYQWFGHLRALGASVHGVPWNDAGPDLERLERLAGTHKPRLFLTSPIVQNPTGGSISQRTAFMLLQLADRYDFHIVQDAMPAVCHPASPPRLAGLDQLNRIVFVNSFSKLLSPRLRVGMLAGHKDLVRDLVDLKLLTQSATSEYTERLVCEVIDQGHYRKFRSRLIARIEKARVAAIRRLEALGLGPAEDHAHGLYAWLDVPGFADTTPLAEAAIDRGMLLAPGAMFRPNMEPSSKMRFNVAFCQNDGTFRELEALLGSQPAS